MSRFVLSLHRLVHRSRKTLGGLANVRQNINASADSNGAFEFVNLKPGHYELVIHADGFSDYKVSSLQLDAHRRQRM